MPRTIVCLCVALLGAGTWQEAAVGGSTLPRAMSGSGGGPLLTAHPLLQASIERIARRSRLWREAVDDVRARGRFALVLTPEQVVVADARGDASTDVFDPSVVAEVSPILDEHARVGLVMVVVNVPLIENVHRRKGSLPGELYADLDRIVTHEIYGHALPYLLAGHMSGRCPDPAPGQRAADACSIRRENAVRAELGLGRRTGYGLEGLALARQPWTGSGD